MRTRVQARSADGKLRLVIRPGADEMRLGYRLPDGTRGELPLATVHGRFGDWYAALTGTQEAPPAREG